MTAAKETLEEVVRENMGNEQRGKRPWRAGVFGEQPSRVCHDGSNRLREALVHHIVSPSVLASSSFVPLRSPLEAPWKARGLEDPQKELDFWNDCQLLPIYEPTPQLPLL